MLYLHKLELGQVNVIILSAKIVGKWETALVARSLKGNLPDFPISRYRITIKSSNCELHLKLLRNSISYGCNAFMTVFHIVHDIITVWH